MYGPQGYYLICVEGQEPGGLIAIPPKGLTLGILDCNINIPDATGKCKINCRGDSVSLNVISGTVIVNDIHVSSQKIISVKNIIKLGSSVFILDKNDELYSPDEEEKYIEATTDKLTGAFNLRAFEDHTSIEIAYALRHNYPISLIMIEIDYYQTILHSYGEGHGLALVKGVAEIITKSKREEDLLARFGGSQMLLFMRDSDSEMSVAFAERLRQKIQNLAIIDDQNKSTTITVSAGVSTFAESKSLSLASFICRAKEALVVAQYHGGNRTHHNDYESII